MNRMIAMRLHKVAAAETSPLVMEQIPLPEPGAGEVLVRVSACGVCHTDLHLVEGEITPARYPIVPGHQVVGTICQTGSGVSDTRIGERVGLPWLYAACGKCGFCLRGEENLCPNAMFTGLHVDGGFAEYVVAKAAYLLRLPESLSDLEAAPLLCAGIIGYRSLRKAEVQAGDRVGLVGFGASAHLALPVARQWGCEVYVITRSKHHRAHALEWGACWAGGMDDPLPVELDKAILFAPSGRLVPGILEKLRPGGVLAINAIYLSDIPSLPYALIYGERTLRSVANATYQDGVEFLQLASQMDLRPTVQVYGLPEANAALIDLKAARFNGEAVLDVRQKI